MPHVPVPIIIIIILAAALYVVLSRSAVAGEPPKVTAPAVLNEQTCARILVELVQLFVPSRKTR